MSIHEAMAAVNAGLSAVGKDAKASMGQGGAFAYRGIDAVVNALHPLLAQHGVVLHHSDVAWEVNGAQMVVLTTEWRFVHTSGEATDPQVVVASAHISQGRGFGVARSYALRELLTRTFTLPTADDAENDENMKAAARADDAVTAARQALRDRYGRLDKATQRLVMDERKKRGWPDTGRLSAGQCDALMDFIERVEAEPFDTGLPDGPGEASPEEVAGQLGRTATADGVAAGPGEGEPVDSVDPSPGAPHPFRKAKR